MNRIDRLILQARKAVSSSLDVVVALIERNGDSWTAEVHLSDEVQGHALTIKRATWATLERAVEHVRAVAEAYPNSRDVPVIIDDLG